MGFSTKGRYATMAMLDLALHYGEGPVLVKDIAARQGLSERYLEHLLLSLKVGGLVKSSRGTHGGFVLSRPPTELTVRDIIQVTEGSMAPADCVDEPDAYPRSGSCAIHELWTELKAAIDGVLQSTTLQDLLSRQRRRWASGQPKEYADTHTGGR